MDIPPATKKLLAHIVPNFAEGIAHWLITMIANQFQFYKVQILLYGFKFD